LCLKISFLSDDAFISYRYAENFIKGDGLVFNQGEKVEGYTNFLWVMISSLLIKINIEPLAGARIISLIFSFLTLFVTYLIAVQIFKVKGIISLLGVTLLALNPGFILWSYSGMETVFFTFLITSGNYFVLKFIDGNKNRFLIYSSIFFSVSALTRPEGVYFFILNFLFIFFISSPGNQKRKVPVFLKKSIIPILIFAFIYGSYFVWRYSYYGFLFPNTFYAKTGFDNQIARGLYYCFKFYRESLAMGLFLIFPAYLVIKEYRNCKIQYMIFIISGFLFYIILVGGDNLLVQRFFIPIMPLIFTLIMLGVDKFFYDFSIVRSMRIIIPVLIISSALFVDLDSRAFPMFGVKRTLSHYENLKKAGIWLKENAKPGQTVAVESAGIIPYYSELKSYDRLGLSDLYISHKGKYDEGSRDKNDEDYILWEKKPDYFIDAFPTLQKIEKPNLQNGEIIYKYYSVPIGMGSIEDKPGLPEEGILYFNFYKREN
ncbi:MAG: glycosyltransferase family 39 protein, partial [bacterium]